MVKCTYTGVSHTENKPRLRNDSGFFIGRNMTTITQHIAEAGVTTQTKIAYVASAATGTASVLTFNEIIGSIGVLGSIIFAGFTAWSNHKRNKVQIELMKKQMNDSDVG